MIDLTAHTARTIAESVRRRELTAVAVTQSALERIATRRHAPRFHYGDPRPQSPTPRKSTKKSRRATPKTCH